MVRPKKEMYNKEQKENYMAYYSQYTKSLEGYFRRLGNAERRANKDLANMNHSELIEALGSLKIRSLEARTHVISLMRPYVSWAALYGLTDSPNVIMEITANSISQSSCIVRQMLSGPDQLDKMINSSMDFTMRVNRSTRDSLILWLLFFGIDNNSLCALRKTDIDHDRLLVRVGDEEYPVSTKVSQLWQQWAAATDIESRGSTMMELVESDNLFRSPITTNNATNKTQNDTLSTNAVIKIVKDAFLNHEPNKDANISVTPQRLNLSGNFYRIWLLEQEGTVVTPDVIARETRIESPPGTETYKSKTRKWGIDYEDWKVAFGYE